MRLWRISAYPGLAGLGGHATDGRWHTRPRPVLYTSEHPALAMVEVMAHMRLSLANIPMTLKLITIEVADGAVVSPTPALPTGWQANETTSQAVGNAWLDSGEGLLLPLPSAVMPDSMNVLINPLHAQAPTHLRQSDIRPFWFDQRLLR